VRAPLPGWIELGYSSDVNGIQIESITGPWASEPAAVDDAIWLVSYAALVGAIPSGTTTLSASTVAGVLSALQRHGIARAVPVGDAGASASKLRRALRSVRGNVDASPLPNLEWPIVGQVLGESLLTELLDVSSSSLRRYTAGERATPQDVATRLHVLALILTDLVGSYNEFGIRRWFGRPRAQLRDRSPQEVLGPGFDPDGAAAVEVRMLSAALLGAGAT